jgi:hypothetical protein
MPLSTQSSKRPKPRRDGPPESQVLTAIPLGSDVVIALMRSHLLAKGWA